MRWIGQFRLNPASGAPDYLLKACLNFWYLIGSGQGELPLVVEFSFDYEALEED